MSIQPCVWLLLAATGRLSASSATAVADPVEAAVVGGGIGTVVEITNFAEPASKVQYGRDDVQVQLLRLPWGPVLEC